MYSKIHVDYRNYEVLRADEEPVIVVCGMTRPDASFPATALRWSANWLYNNPSTMGTLALSREIFLEGRLLPLLESINRATTLLPAKLDMDAGDWEVEFTSWEKKYNDSKYATTRLASWEPLPSTRHAFE